MIKVLLELYLLVLETWHVSPPADPVQLVLHFVLHLGVLDHV